MRLETLFLSHREVKSILFCNISIKFFLKKKINGALRCYGAKRHPVYDCTNLLFRKQAGVEEPSLLYEQMELLPIATSQKMLRWLTL